MRRMNAMMIALAALGWAGTAAADDVLQPVRIESGLLNGDARDFSAVPIGTVRVEGVNALRVVFDQFEVGDRTVVMLQSVEDGAVQILDRVNLERWKAGSAYFNGDTVEVSVMLAPEDRDVRVSIAGALVDVTDPAGDRTICGLNDDRVASNDARVARLGTGNPNGCSAGGGCTAWLFSNGALMTAGHCGPGGNALVQFNVPLSDANGNLNFPPPEDQYLVDGATVVNANTGNMNDWSTFAVFPNANTGLMPAVAQGAFFRGTIEAQAPTNIRITGFGFDDAPPGSCNWVNTHKAQQTHAGTYIGYTDNGATERFESYRADTRGANSGSPIQMDSSGMTLGIHTNGGCAGANPETGANTGPSFRNTALRSAVENFLGSNARYVDVGHTSNVETGTVFQPFDRLLEGYNSIGAGGTVYLVRGNYTAADGNAVLLTGKNVLLRAPVGSVLIGN